MNRIPRGSYVTSWAARHLTQDGIDALEAAKRRGDITDFRATMNHSSGAVKLILDVGGRSEQWFGRGDELVARALGEVRL